MQELRAHIWSRLPSLPLGELLRLPAGMGPTKESEGFRPAVTQLDTRTDSCLCKHTDWGPLNCGYLRNRSVDL